MEYVETSKRTLVGNIGLALCLTISGMYQPWLLRYRFDTRYNDSEWEYVSTKKLYVKVPWRLESVQLGRV